MRRRNFITLLGGAAAGAFAPLREAAAQAPAAALRVGSCSQQPRATSFLQAFDLRMSELGYVEGRNYTLDYIDLQGRADRYDDAMQQLVARKADVLVSFGPEQSLKAALAATRSIPIVMVAIDYDPIALGYVTSLARPTGNVTGLLLEQIDGRASLCRRIPRGIRGASDLGARRLAPRRALGRREMLDPTRASRTYLVHLGIRRSDVGSHGETPLSATAAVAASLVSWVARDESNLAVR